MTYSSDTRPMIEWPDPKEGDREFTERLVDTINRSMARRGIPLVPSGYTVVITTETDS